MNDKTTLSNEYYIKKALLLARKGAGRVSPNPMVGALVVKDNTIMGTGYHHYYGGDHAEIDAIRDAKGQTEKATLYVTLEPCCHYEKKTPPCTEAILESKFSKVVIGTLDPNPLVAGKAIKIFRQHNIETEVGVLENECHKLNEAYWKYISSRIPFVTLKYAQSLDGKIATASGNSQWISSPPSQKLAHRLRSINDGILVGINTVLLDNPELTTRLVKGKNPLRIVLDSKLKISLGAKVLKEQIVAPTLIATTAQADRTKLAELKTAGVEVLVVREDKNGGISLPDLLGILGERNIASLLVEGGATTITSFLQAGLADKVIMIIAPKIIGRGIEAIGDLNTVDIDQALTLSPTRVHRSGPDIIVEAEFIKKWKAAWHLIKNQP